MRALFHFSLSFSLLLLACDPETGGRPRRDVGPGGADSGPGIDVGPRPDIGPRPDTGGMECSAISVMAESTLAPVDIVWVIDNSGSMSEEADLIQARLNDFADSINAAGLDVHVVLITRAGFVEVPPPLGTDASRFLRVDEDVQSSNSLEKLLSTYDRWEGFVRRSATLHFVIVTDDESDLAAASFRTQMQELTLRTFRSHVIVSPPGSRHMAGGFFEMDGCAGPHGEAADNGDIYWELASSTGGLQLSICDEDWTRLFTQLNMAIAVPRTLPCVFEIPEPPAGEEFDPLRVNVEYTMGGGGTETIPNVGTFDRCTMDGWYYEGEDAMTPERIVLCPNTCRRLESDVEGRVDIALGCATLLI